MPTKKNEEDKKIEPNEEIKETDHKEYDLDEVEEETATISSISI